MKRSLFMFAMGVTIIGAWSLGQVQGQKSEEKVVYVSSAKADYKLVTKGVWEAAIWGDSDKGAHATFTKFEPGQDNGMHTHSNDVWIVVLKGAYLYKAMPAEARWLERFSARPRRAQTEAAQIKKRARCSMRKGRGSSI